MSTPPGDPTRRVALVETSEALPGLLPFQAWDVLGTADVVLLRDPEHHPSAPHLLAAGLDLERLEPARLERGDLDLARPGLPDDRRIAKALVQRATVAGAAVYLLGPGDEGVAPALSGMAAEHDVEIELVFLVQAPQGTELLRLVEVMRRLRSPDTGCPWDLQQDHRSLVGYLIEEAYELIDAIERGDDRDLEEELGDLLLQVVFHAQVAFDRRAFGIDDVARGIVAKLVRRHPHVFGDVDVSSADEVQANWDRLKAAEKAGDGPFEGVPALLPGLHLLETLQRKAAKLGFERLTGEEALALAHEAADLLGQGVADAPGRAGGGAPDPGPAGSDVEVALGELLFAAVTLARQRGVDPEAAARAAGRRFRARVEAMVRAAAEPGPGAGEGAGEGGGAAGAAGAPGAAGHVARVDAATWRRLWSEVADAERGDE